MKIIKWGLKLVQFYHDFLNKKNKDRLINSSPTLLCSNCTGGFIYHWLGLKFNSPFINLWMTPEDFVLALENFDEFISTPLICDENSNSDYPIGIGFNGVKIHFLHYQLH